MGADWFYTEAEGATVKEAFRNAREEALHEHGHSGYTGTIAEKSSFKLVTLPEGKTAWKFADECAEDEGHFTDDKWGPCAAVKVTEGRYAFFGWASS